MMMIFSNKVILWFISLASLTFAVKVFNTDSDVRAFLGNLNKKSAEIASTLAGAQWMFEFNNTEIAQKHLFQVTSENIKNAKLRFQQIVSNYPWKSFMDHDVQRQLRLLSDIGMLALPADDFQMFQKIVSNLDVIQQNTTICDYYNKTKCDLHLIPDIQEKLKSSQNLEELSYLWSEWRKASEPELKSLLDSYVKLCNQVATLNNYTNFQEYSLRKIDVENVKEEMISLWNSVKPLYLQIHAYVRRKLRDIYGEKAVPQRGAIPEHLLGNIWSEDWSGIAHRMVPFPDLDNLNFTSSMISQGYDTNRIHRAAEDLFASMNFSLPQHLWVERNKSASKNPESCHPKVFNFNYGNILINDCEEVSWTNYLTDCGLLTKAEYMLQYSHQPYVYQASADPGLEEALNDMIKISASTFTNLKHLELYKGEVNEEIRLNRLFKLALEKVVSIPFLMTQEFWRWDVYNKKSIDETTCSLQDIREKFQGISTFTKELSFDPSGTGSVFSELSLAHNFFGRFLEFQMYESLCNMSQKGDGENHSLDECSLYGNAEAGVALRNMMASGSSKFLMETVALITGQNRVNPESLLKYFSPLMNWLTKENERTGELVGWENSEHCEEERTNKIRRKRSLKQYQSDDKQTDTYNTASREPDRFQRLIYKRSKDKLSDSEMNERKRKSSENDQHSSDKKLNENEAEKVEENAPQSFMCPKNRRSLFKSSKNLKENSKESQADEEVDNENPQMYKKFSSRSNKRQAKTQSYVPSSEYSKVYGRILNNRKESTYQKRNDNSAGNYNYENTGAENNPGTSSARSGNSNNRVRYARKIKKKQRRSANEDAVEEYNRNRPSRDAQWHTKSKKDISRLLHSFGFAVENDDKDKIKEIKKKLKGDSNSDLKSNIASKESSYENLLEFNRLKSGDGRSDMGEDKGANKLWSVKSFVADNPRALQSNPMLDKKDSLSGSHESLLSHLSDEKIVGKKETSSGGESSLTSGKERNSESSERGFSSSRDSTFGQFSIDSSSLQALLRNADLNSYGQKAVYTMTPELFENKQRGDLSQVADTKNNNKFGNYFYNYPLNKDAFQHKEKKEYREEPELGGKSPYVIILGQVTPELKERLMQEKGVMKFTERDKQQLQSTNDEKKISDKKSRASGQIYIIPLDMKNFQQNLMKTNHYAEHEHEAGHDPSTEREQDSEEEQLRLENNSKLKDISSYYKSEKNPSEYIISCNNENKRKIVKRSKREHKLEKGDEKLKVVRLAPMKESVLEGLIGKSLDHVNLDDQNVKILIHDDLLNGNSDLSSALSSASLLDSSSSASSPLMGQGSGGSMQPSLASLTSNVLSAFAPKNYQQVTKTSSHRRNSNLDEDTLKDSIGSPANGKEQKEQELPYLVNPGLRCNSLLGKKKAVKIYSDDESKKLGDIDSAAKGDDNCCKKIILTPCPPKPCPCPGPCPGPCPCPLPFPCPCPCPEPECKRVIEIPCPCPPSKPCCPCDPCCCPDLCKKPSECSLVNCQFKITKAKKPHERLTIMIYDRINPPAELPEPYDALAVISEILQRIQCCQCKPSCQLTEEDPDYPSNDNSDQLKGNPNQPQENKAKIQEISGEIPIISSDSSEEEENDENIPNSQNSPTSAEEDKYQIKEKATPALDQLTVFNKDKLKPVFIELRKVSI